MTWLYSLVLNAKPFENGLFIWVGYKIENGMSMA